MTERMEPTNRLRWARRINYAANPHDSTFPARTYSERVLQQLWRDLDAAAMGYVVEEWRDVPVEDAE